MAGRVQPFFVSFGSFALIFSVSFTSTALKKHCAYSHRKLLHEPCHSLFQASRRPFLPPLVRFSSAQSHLLKDAALPPLRGQPLGFPLCLVFVSPPCNSRSDADDRCRLKHTIAPDFCPLLSTLKLESLPLPGWSSLRLARKQTLVSIKM